MAGDQIIRTDDQGRPLCEGLTKRKTRCLARALPGSPFCETHDPSMTPRGSAKIRAAREAWAAERSIGVTDKRAERYRLMVAEGLLREAGFVPDGKGGWHPGVDDDAPSDG
jgi:hypothetical protein